MHEPWMWEVGVPGVAVAGWVPGGGIPGTIPSRLHWYCQGPILYLIQSVRALHASTGHSRPLQGPPHTQLLAVPSYLRYGEIQPLIS